MTVSVGGVLYMLLGVVVWSGTAVGIGDDRVGGVLYMLLGLWCGQVRRWVLVMILSVGGVLYMLLPFMMMW